METKVEKSVLVKIGRKIQYANCFGVPRHNTGGGLALFWATDSNVDVQSFSKNHIDAIIDHGVDDAWRFTGFYGDPETANRENSWSMLRSLSTRFTLPWNVWIRLNRGVATIDWILRFPSSRIHHLDAFHSDHKPIFLSPDSEINKFYKKGHPFRFEAMWLRDRSCEEVIRESWGDGMPQPTAWGFNSKVLACQSNLRVWNKKTFGHVRYSLKQKLAKLKSEEESGGYGHNPSRIQVLREDIQQLQAKEECMWKQGSRNIWHKEGDRNTKYFHCRANQRNRRNLITGLEDDNGNWVEDEAGLGKVVEGYFEQIFTSSNPSGFDNTLGGILSTAGVDLIDQLDGDFQASEVKETLNQMAPLMAPSPDGMSPIFYKSFWHIMGEDVTAVVLQALNSGIVPESINTTFITLIPKIKNPKKLSDFKPISLCNVIYKLIAKVVANRLKKFLANSMPDSQSAFLSG
ncbi:hypothetical protein SO802_027156 [Lithocarpus litseifolius]|uniref:Reverse transcriptase domain-containing protein n=1 Tax=Lithocarpus litseifolius TaxID=425828 RepID=A0AAW2C3H7_9ROSI